MAIPRALLFSGLVPLANIAAVDVAAFLKTGWARGFTPEVVQQFTSTVGSQLNLVWAAIYIVMCGMTFGAWLSLDRGRAASTPIRAMVFVFAVLTSALLPMALAFVVFGDVLTGLLVPVSISGIAVALVSKQAPQTFDSERHEGAEVSGSRTGFGRRGT